MSEEKDKRVYSVIFADDDEDTLAILYVLGRNQGWNVEIANSAEDLLEKVENRCHHHPDKCFDIVVTDVQFFRSNGMPGVSGITAARQLEKAFPDLPILFLSGYGGLLTRENISQLRNTEFLEKPFEPSQLISRIEYLINFMQPQYKGIERRKTSVNRTSNRRRRSDNHLQIPLAVKIAFGQNR